MSTCTSRITITGDSPYAGTVVTCDHAEHHGTDLHTGPIPGSESEGVPARHAWTDMQADVGHEDDAVSLGEPDECSHTDAEHEAMAADHASGHPFLALLQAVGMAPPPAPVAPPEPDMDAVLAQLRNMENVHAAILGAATRHREACEAAGFSPTAAEGLAFQFYQQALGK